MHLIKILFTWIPLSVGFENEELLDQLSMNVLQIPHSEGEFTYKTAQIRLFGKRNSSAMQQLHETLGEFPELSIHSVDNSLALEAISTAATKAYEASKYGDFFYLWQVMFHNGYAAQINDISNGEFHREIFHKLGGIPNITDLLTGTSTNPKVADMYIEMPKEMFNDGHIVPRGDVTVCTCDNLPNISDCELLIEGLGNGVVYPRQKAWCHGACCVSWNKGVTFYTFWAQRKAGWCMNHCIYNGFSCKIENIRFYEKRVNFCTSSVAACN